MHVQQVLVPTRCKCFCCLYRCMTKRFRKPFKAGVPSIDRLAKLFRRSWTLISASSCFLRNFLNLAYMFDGQKGSPSSVVKIYPVLIQSGPFRSLSLACLARIRFKALCIRLFIVTSRMLVLCLGSFARNCETDDPSLALTLSSRRLR